jgi:hypothetical protein
MLWSSMQVEPHGAAPPRLPTHQADTEADPMNHTGKTRCRGMNPFTV